MFLIDSKRIGVMRQFYESRLPDRCIIAKRSDTLSDSGQPVASYDTTTYTDIPCGFEFSPFKFRSREVVAGGEGTSEILVRARMSVDYFNIVESDDRIVLTSRNGETYSTAETYEIQGFAERGLVGMVLNLKRAEP